MRFSIMLLSPLFFISLTALTYACNYNFCSSIACKHDSTCIDACNGGYWYSGGVCSSDCAGHCKYQNRACEKKCGAQCEQSSDCSCPQNGCIGQDYYEYTPLCNESCRCECSPAVSTNDSRCVVCDPNNVDCNNPACSNDIKCIPCDTDRVNCSVPACANNTKCLPCDTSNVDCNIAACANNTKCLPCDTSNMDCSIAACANNTQCFPCDTNNVDCSLPACTSNPTCAPAPPQTGGGGTIISGGYMTPISISVCGDGICSSNENCSSCPKDCLNKSEVCCAGVAYVGNCCMNSDCINGYECVGKRCQPLPNVTKVCKEDWVCQDWTECSNGAQMRTCVDKNNCGTIHERPDLVERCTVVSSASPITGLPFFLTPAAIYGLILAIMSVFLLMLYLSRKKQTTKTGNLKSDVQAPEETLKSQ